MEDELKKIMDNLDLEQSEKLLGEEMEFKIDKKVLKRIKKSVFKKAEIRRKFWDAKKISLLSAAAVLILIFNSIGFDRVSATIKNIFSFIPNYGIVEEENADAVNFILDEERIAENDDVIIKLIAVFAKNNELTATVTIENKNHADDKIKELENAPQGMNVKLIANDVENKADSYSSSGGGAKAVGYFRFSATTAIELDYKIVFEDYDLSIDFKLKEAESFEDLSQIGPTGVNNNISITAVPEFKENLLKINLYPMNKSEYNIYSYFAETYSENKGYKGKDMHLETDSGVKKYILPESFGSANGEFSFEIEPSDKKFVLKIPFITVQKNEYKDIKLRIPEKGEILDCDYEIEFEDSIVKITELKRTEEPLEYGGLEMKFEYINKSEKFVIKDFTPIRINAFGKFLGGGGWSEYDDDSILKIFNYQLEKGEDEFLYLRFQNPIYYLFGEYSLSFER